MSRRDFEKGALGLLGGMAFPLEQLKRVDSDHTTLEYWLKELELDKKTPLVVYRITPKLDVIGLPLGFFGGGNVKIYLNSNKNSYNGQIIVSIRENIIFRRHIIHASQGYRDNSGLYIPIITTRINLDGNDVDYTNIRYDRRSNKAVFKKGNIIFYYDPITNEPKYNDDGIEQLVDIEEANLNKSQIGDLVSEFFNLSSYKNIIITKKSKGIYSVSKEPEDNKKPRLYFVSGRLEDKVDDDFPISTDLGISPQNYPISSDFSKLLGMEKGGVMIKGYVDEDFVPSIAHIFNFIPLVTLRITRERYDRMKYLAAIK
ncbi:hypothetical protein HYX17_02895 [Candidatus Woesearchaeota archaeon]|nr:hypothetical protein [Candidatus Woesearchaeota archaeon]